LTVFPSDFNNIYLKYFGILQNLMRNYEISQMFMKVDESYDIPRYFFSQIPCFRYISFYCYVLFAFVWTRPQWLRQTDRQAGRQTDGQTETHTDRQTDRQTDRKTDRQADMDRQTDGQADRQTERWTDR